MDDWKTPAGAGVIITTLVYVIRYTMQPMLQVRKRIKMEQLQEEAKAKETFAKVQQGLLDAHVRVDALQHEQTYQFGHISRTLEEHGKAIASIKEDLAEHESGAAVTREMSKATREMVGEIQENVRALLNNALK